jgi:hypothetical protein
MEDMLNCDETSRESEKKRDKEDDDGDITCLNEEQRRAYDIIDWHLHQQNRQVGVLT